MHVEIADHDCQTPSLRLPEDKRVEEVSKKWRCPVCGERWWLTTVRNYYTVGDSLVRNHRILIEVIPFFNYRKWRWERVMRKQLMADSNGGSKRLRFGGKQP